MINIWKQLKKPIMMLAPLEDVTDAAFRFMIAKYGKPDLMFTEFTSADALCTAGRESAMVNFRYTESERPIIAQIFGKDPKNFFNAAKIIASLGFDGIDINMGCPEKSIVKSGSCAGLIKTPKLAQEIIKATKAGSQGLPVSVKTRIGFTKNELETWIPTLLVMEPAAITVHGRTRKQMSKVPNDWSAIARCVELRDMMGSDTLIIGNGDAKDMQDGLEKVKQYGVDGVMFGRAIFGNPWLFNTDKKTITHREKLEVMLEHTKLFDTMFGKTKNFMIMKKHFKAYISGWDGARGLRVQLMETKNAGEVEKIVHAALADIQKQGIDTL